MVQQISIIEKSAKLRFARSFFLFDRIRYDGERLVLNGLGLTALGQTDFTRRNRKYLIKSPTAIYAHDAIEKSQASPKSICLWRIQCPNNIAPAIPNNPQVDLAKKLLTA